MFNKADLYPRHMYSCWNGFLGLRHPPRSSSATCAAKPKSMIFTPSRPGDGPSKSLKLVPRESTVLLKFSTVSSSVFQCLPGSSRVFQCLPVHRPSMDSVKDCWNRATAVDIQKFCSTTYIDWYWGLWIRIPCTGRGDSCPGEDFQACANTGPFNV